MKFLNFSVIVFVAFFVRCTNDVKQKNIEFITITGERAKGILYPDSTLHGIVRYYNPMNDEYSGYTIYKHGAEIGPYVKVDRARKIDSFTFNSPIRSGYEYLFDAVGRVSYKAYLQNDRVVGPTCVYDTLGQVTSFYFYSFEGDILYQAKFAEKGKLEKGDLINFKLHERSVNDSLRQMLFLYIIKAPHYDDFYELAIMDEKKKIISSRRVKTDNFYYETILDSILPTQHYAIIYHYSYIQKPGESLIIQELY